MPKKLSRKPDPCPADGFGHVFVFPDQDGRGRMQGRCRKCGRLSISHRTSEPTIAPKDWLNRPI